MTILQEFVAFAEGLPPEQRHEIEDFSASIMGSDSPEFALTAGELAEIDRRIADAGSKRIDDATFWAKLPAPTPTPSALPTPTLGPVAGAKPGETTGRPLACSDGVVTRTADVTF